MKLAAVAGAVGLLMLAGCSTSSTSSIAGLGTGAVAGAATASPAVGYLVAVSVAAGADAVVKYYGRSRQHAEQNAIADVAGSLPEGAAAPWHIRHTIPIGNEHGIVRVTRQIVSPLADCREILFSVEDPPAPPAWYSSSICNQMQRWKWAEAEPAVERWGFLQ